LLLMNEENRLVREKDGAQSASFFSVFS
jgi:hypothetical protein